VKYNSCHVTLFSDHVPLSQRYNFLLAKRVVIGDALWEGRLTTLALAGSNREPTAAFMIRLWANYLETKISSSANAHTYYKMGGSRKKYLGDLAPHHN